MSIRSSASSVAMLFLMCGSLQAQWVKVPPKNIPRTPDGKVNLSAPAPKLPDGTPDLSGIWEPSRSYVGNIAADLKEELPYLPATKALVEQRKTGAHANEDPPAHCLPQGLPRLDSAPAPWRVVQTPGYIAVLYEAFGLWRQIFTDGRELGKEFTPTWLGYSTGKWEGDTLVVETKGFNGEAWMDQMGRPTSESTRVIERFHRKDYGHMDLQITVDDPKLYTKPWTVNQAVRLAEPGLELMEYVCVDRDLSHLPGNGRPAR
jgi:hypothetical protein